MVNLAEREVEETPRKKVLVVDDEKGFTDVMRFLLERTGRYRVCCENDPGHAVEAAHAFHPDMVFLDIVMPGIDGGEVAYRFHRDKELRSTPVVMLTALLDDPESEGQVVRNEDGQQMLGKPVSLATLCECIDCNTKRRKASASS